MFVFAKKIKKQSTKTSSSFVNAIKSAAKQAADEEALLGILRRDCVAKSMKPDGDCAFELMCRWRSVLAYRRFGRPLPGKVLEEVVSSQQISSMRHAIADAQERHDHDKKNNMLHHLIKQSLVDWSHSPSENGGRNAEVQATLSSLPPAVDESEWLDSKDAIDLHSLLIRTGKNQVFGEASELEAFSLMVEFPLAIYLPGHCELFPKSTQYDGCKDYLLGICNGNHYYLAVPKTWIHSIGWFFFFYVCYFTIFCFSNK